MEKKRVRLNIVDIIVIAVVIIAVGFFAWRVKTADQPTFSTGHTQRLDYEVVVDIARSQLADFYAAQEYPAQMVASGKSVNGFVDAVTADYHDAERVELNYGAAIIRLKPDSKWYCRLKFTCHAFVNSTDLTDLVGGQEIRAGANYLVKTLNFEHSGQIISLTRKDAE
ncbi:MAG: DUF4330 family protein [Oscillospiraceae bacterium]|jgi:hypothetical protein|nr:DUF4330 family protein [Oscillospiraceae bacterium]